MRRLQIVLHFRPLFQGIRVPIDYILSAFQQLLLGMPAPVAIIVFALIAWQISSLGMGVATLVSLIAIGAIGAWSQAMVTLALVLTALLFCMVIGLPLGIWLARSPRAAKIIRPLLDAMQTTPAFVYLVPIVMLFGIGNGTGRGGDDYLRPAADRPSDHPRDKPGACGSDRSVALIWRQPAPAAV